MAQMKTFPAKEFPKFRKMLRKQGQTFEERSTTVSREIRIGEERYFFADKLLHGGQLNMINEIRREVRKRIEEKDLEPPPKASNIRYQRFDTRANNVEEGETYTYEDVVELDIEKAYFQAAYILGYLKEELYKKYMDLEKKDRLFLMGSLATYKTILYYKNGELDSTDHETDELLRRVFFHLVDYVDRILFDLSEMAEGSFLFYWVDGIYLIPYEGLDRHTRYLEDRYGVRFKKERVHKVEVECRKKGHNVVHVTDDEGTRPFTAGNIFVEQ